METSQLIIMVIAAIVNEIVKRVMSFTIDKLKKISITPAANTIVRAMFNRLLLIVLIQSSILVLLLYAFFALSQSHAPVTHASVAFMTIFYSVCLRVAYSSLKAVKNYIDYSKVLCGKQK